MYWYITRGPDSTAEDSTAEDSTLSIVHIWYIVQCTQRAFFDTKRGKLRHNPLSCILQCNGSCNSCLCFGHFLLDNSVVCSIFQCTGYGTEIIRSTVYYTVLCNTQYCEKKVNVLHLFFPQHDTIKHDTIKLVVKFSKQYLNLWGNMVLTYLLNV